MPTSGNVTAIAIAANIESIAKAISANSTFKTVPQNCIGPTFSQRQTRQNDGRHLQADLHVLCGRIARDFLLT